MGQWICYAVGNKPELGGGQLLLSVISPAGALSGIYVRESGEQIEREWNGKGRPTGEAERGCSSQKKVKCRDCQHFSWREKLRKDRMISLFILPPPQKITLSIKTSPHSPSIQVIDSTTAPQPCFLQPSFISFGPLKEGEICATFPLRQEEVMAAESNLTAQDFPIDTKRRQRSQLVQQWKEKEREAVTVEPG